MWGSRKTSCDGLASKKDWTMHLAVIYCSKKSFAILVTESCSPGEACQRDRERGVRHEAAQLVPRLRGPQRQHRLASPL